MRDMERTPISNPESLRVRCPHCRKLYLVQYNDMQEAKPRFECVACHDRFWISLADMDFSTEVVGLPIDVKEVKPTPRPKSDIKPEAATEPCPKCFKLNPPSAKECNHCGVIFAKTRKDLDFKEPVPPHSKSLEALWHTVISNYDESKHHDEFINAAVSEGNLAYPAALYAQMLKLMPVDDISQSRLRQVQSMGESILPPRTPRERSSAWTGTRVWQIPFLGGIICLGVGLAIPPLRNIAGVGAALLFLAVALRRR